MTSTLERTRYPDNPDEWTGREPCRSGLFGRDLWQAPDDEGDMRRRRNASEHAAAYERAANLCHTCCPRRALCAREALAMPSNEGVWAGVILPPPTAWRNRVERAAALHTLAQIAAGLR